jgi:hypothetical protein
MTTAIIHDRPNQRHTHKPNGADPATERCPWCGSVITRVEFRRIHDQIAEQERARVTKAEQTLRQQFAREQQQAATKASAEIEKAKREAAKLADQQIKKAKADQDAVIAVRLDAEREAAAKKLAKGISAEKVRAFEEKTKLTEQLAEMQRKLEKKTAFELGEQPEVDLFEALETAFPEDRVWRIVKGQPGPDVVVEVIHGGEPVGKIVLDSKNHARWSNKFTTKLRADQLVEGADFAILSTSVFPAGARELHIQDNVIVASPQRVVVLVHLLRRQIVENYRLKLSADSRQEKADRLYALMTSDQAADLWERHGRATSGLLDIEKSDAAWQEKTRNRRTELIHAAQGVHEEFLSAIDRIIEAAP